MKSLYPSIRLTDSNFKYVSSAKTDIRDTFRKFTVPGGQDSLKPLVPILNPEGFVLSVEWFEFVD